MNSNELPQFRTTEEAVAFGLTMSKDQFLMCLGAREALEQTIRYIADSGAGYSCLNIQAHLAFRIQMLREAMECAPNSTLVAILKAKNESGIQETKKLGLNFEPVEAGAL